MKSVVLLFSFVLCFLGSIAQVDTSLNISNPMIDRHLELLDSMIKAFGERASNDSTSEPFRFFELQQPAQFVGGDSNWFKFVQENLEYPPEIPDKDLSGTLAYRCIVEVDHELKIISMLSKNTLGEDADIEARRVIMLANGLWLPGKVMDRKVRSEVIIPVRFKLVEEDKLPDFSGNKKKRNKK